MQLIAQDLDQRILIKLADVDDGRAQRPPRSSLRGQPPIELLLGEEATLNQDITKLTPIDSKQFFPWETVRGLIPTDPLTRPQVLKIPQGRAGNSKIVHDVCHEIPGYDERELRPPVNPACPDVAVDEPVHK